MLPRRQYESPGGDVFVFEHREDEGRRITQYLFKGSAVNFKRVHGVWVDMTGPATGPETNAHFHTLWAMYEDVLAPSDCPALRA